MSEVHYLKIAPQYFAEVESGKKTFEIRSCTDRTFNAGDAVVLKEWAGDYTGKELSAIIGYVTDYQQRWKTVVFSLLNVKHHGQ